MRIRAGIKRLVGNRHVDGAVLGSVAPSMNQSWTDAVRDLLGLKLLTVSHKLDLGVAIDYPKPSKIGADRLANACAAVHRYGSPVLVTDFGTALTFDIIAGGDRYVGGVIAPGLPLMTDYLAEKTELLPHIRLTQTDTSIGKSTREAMCVGGSIGYRGMVRELITEIKRDLGVKRLTIVATGGYSEWVLKGLQLPIEYWPDLTLIGLGRIYELNADR